MGSTEVLMDETDNESSFTAMKEFIMSYPMDTKLVRIHDANLSRGDLERLLKSDGWLSGDVVNAGIYCLRTQDLLHSRAGGRVFLESTHVSGILKRDAKVPISPNEHTRIMQRVLNYVQHDMIFVPINVTECHWFLCNVDAKNRQLQVLDSFGSRMSRRDLHLTGLEKHLTIASQTTNEFNKDGRWPDIEVTKWPVLECIPEPMQSDGSSCGLFLLKLMEHWTGLKLAKELTQEGIKLFRKQLPTILYESNLNEIKGKPEYHEENNKRDKGHVVSCDNDVPKATSVSQASKRAKYPSLSSTVPKTPINKNELASKLRNYILSIKDDDSMKEIWVQSSKPYPIRLCLKQLKQLLDDKHGMDTSCFNMAVRIHATDELQWFNENPSHNMDLQFCDIVTDSMRDPKLRLPFDTKRHIIAKLFDCWPEMFFHVPECNTILLPYHKCGLFILFAFSLSEKTVTILDPVPLSDMWKNSMADKYTLKLKDISFHLNIALQDAIPGWNDDVFLWRRIRTPRMTKNHDSNMSGFLVLKCMRSWNGKEVAEPFVRDAYEIQNKVLVHMLTYKDNECQANIPQDVQALVKRIGIDYFL